MDTYHKHCRRCAEAELGNLASAFLRGHSSHYRLNRWRYATYHHGRMVKEDERANDIYGVRVRVEIEGWMTIAIRRRRSGSSLESKRGAMQTDTFDCVGTEYDSNTEFLGNDGWSL